VRVDHDAFGCGGASPVSGSTAHPDMWVDPQDDPRAGTTVSADECGILHDYLRDYRSTLEMKCVDLDAEQLASRSVPPSTMSLLGLVRNHPWWTGTTS